jgi:hypothetical protein
MNPQHQRVLRWICTGRYIVETDYIKPAAGGDGSVPIDYGGNNINKNNNYTTQPVANTSPPSPTRSSTSTSIGISSSSSPSLDRLIGVDDGDDNPLIPPSSAIDRVFRVGRAI